jgi:hypothetical protein
MNEPEIRNDQFGLENLNNLEELSMAALTKFNLLKIFSSLTDTAKLKQSILGMEAWMFDELKEDYWKQVKDKEEELELKYGSKLRDDYVNDLFIFRLRLLSSIIKLKIPMEMNVRL